MARASGAPIDARRGMILVWFAITAVWLVFWSAVAALVLANFDVRLEEVGPLVAIILAPPVALLAVGVFCRWLFELATARRAHPRTEKAPCAVANGA